MTDPSVVLERRGAVALVVMNEPESRNAMRPSLRGALVEAFAGLIADPNCRAIVLTGSGKSFCAGGDLGSLPDHDPQAVRLRLEQAHRLLRMIAAGPKPVVAAVNGYAFGAGLSLAAACDFVLAAESASFGAVFGKVGLMADMGLLWSLPQRVGLAETRRLLFSAATVPAEEAVSLGLADRLVEDTALAEAAWELAAGMAEAPPLALAATKALLARGPAPLESVLATELDHQTLLFSSEDFVEGRAAFLERRPPRFAGR
ncbi:MAG: enoyl-CoA hydratase/isomerase family protein [Tistlia sp.]|uniref:enoyl-CoA hydratase/isomerase family protein n=1 Tax=Tistlia sp. TaxID=3057121 RepID=UPI0034A31DF4